MMSMTARSTVATQLLPLLLQQQPLGLELELVPVVALPLVLLQAMVATAAPAMTVTAPGSQATVS